LRSFPLAFRGTSNSEVIFYNKIFDSENNDNNDLPSVKQILASLKRVKRVISLTSDDNNNRESGNGDFTKVSSLRTTRTARYLARLILPFLIDRL
jgi:hypothetical protein